MNRFDKSGDELFMQRCIELALAGSGYTAPNPMVGAVLVYEDKIIGEGFHHAFGKPHAEVNAVNDAITKGNGALLEKATLYVNLEPCSHVGKTPPCTELIIRNKIPEVVIGCLDPFPEVNGSGLIKLSDAGVRVRHGILENESTALNRRFITYHTKKRPYIILKYAETTDHFIASVNPREKKISNEQSDILVHKWRTEEAAIMVGTLTAEIDNPQLTARLWSGNNPDRIVIDKNLRLPRTLNLFDGSVQTYVFNNSISEKHTNLEYVKIGFTEKFLEEILNALFERKILSVMVEGGARILQQLIDAGLWDEARIITSAVKKFSDGIRSPVISGEAIAVSDATGDRITILHPKKNN